MKTSRTSQNMKFGIKTDLRILRLVLFWTVVSNGFLFSQTNDTIISGNQLLFRIQYGNTNFKHTGYRVPEFGTGPDIGTVYGLDFSSQYIFFSGSQFQPGFELGSRYVNFNNDNREHFIASRFLHARLKVFVHYNLYSGYRMQIMPGIGMSREWNLWSDNRWRSKNPFEAPYFLYPEGFHPRHEEFGGYHMDLEITGLYRIRRGFLLTVTSAYNIYDRMTYQLKQYDESHGFFNGKYRFTSGLSVKAGLAYVLNF